MLLNVCVVLALVCRLVSWCIIETLETDMSFLTLFYAIKQGKFGTIPSSSDLEAANLLQVAVGESQDTLMTTSPSLSVLNVCEAFGKFVKFTVEVDSESSTPGSNMSLINPASSSNTLNAFQVMMAAQRKKQLGDNELPFVVVVKNNKDRMYNDLISLMKELGIKWNDPEAYGEPFLRKLCDVLWYLEGHHHTIAEHSPSLFSNFPGYNCPNIARDHRET